MPSASSTCCECGTYYETVCYFDPHDPEAECYAFACEDGLPEYWDDMARQEIMT